METQEIGYVLPMDAWAALAALQGATSFWAPEGDCEPDAAKGWGWLLDAELAQETQEHLWADPSLMAIVEQMIQTREVLCIRQGQRNASLFQGPDFTLMWESLPGNMVRVTPYPGYPEALGSVEERLFTPSAPTVHACCSGPQGTKWKKQLSREELRAL